MSIVILIIGVAAIALGYGLYARRIDRKIIQPDDAKTTPAKMYMGGVVVNMLIDKGLIGDDAPDFVKNRVAMQDEYMDEIWRVFPDVRAVVPLFDTEVQGVDMLKRTADHLFA